MTVLILVHIGNTFPEYLNTCIAQIISVSSIKIHLLINNSNINNVKFYENRLIVYPLENIVKDDLHKSFEIYSKLDTTFRNGFWTFTTLRFFYLYNYVKQFNLTDIFHIEYDNLIYYDVFKNILPFQKKEMWCVMDAPKRCIPSFLYFKGESILMQLLKTIIQCSSKQMNDMESLAIFYLQNNSVVGSLPIVSNYVDPIDPLYYKHASDFGFLFDAACVGQYIGGVDPRNDSSNTIGFINETSVIKCNKMKIEFINKKPLLNGMPLVNLHIHSKELKRWCLL
jgi:hypothetical protein